MRWSVVLLIGLLAILAACGKAECKEDADCAKEHFTAQCVKKQCVYEPIAGECGNLDCEAGENECTCSMDCGTCAGTAPSKYLTKGCDVNDECVTVMKKGAQQPITRTDEVSTAGDRYKLTSTYNNPFNIVQDKWVLEIGLVSATPSNDRRVIRRIEITAQTPDKRTLTLAQKDINRALWATGSKFSIKERMQLEIPGTKKEGLLTNPTITITYDYEYGSSGTPKTGTIKRRLSGVKINWARPEGLNECPNCDDGNAGTKDICGPDTNFICEHEPIAGACGNHQCDAGENECTCATDCGPCQGQGQYTTKSCVQETCRTTLKPDARTEPQNIFDPRTLGKLSMNMNYKFNKPFNTRTDTFTIDFELTDMRAGVSDVSIDTIRILDGAKELAVEQPGIVVSGGPKTVTVSVNPLAKPEEDRTTTVAVWYSWMEGGAVQSDNFNKGLGRITYITAE